MKRTNLLFVLLIIIAAACARDGYEYSEAVVVQTSKSGDKLSEKGLFNLSSQGYNSDILIKLEPDTLYQKIVGFGGAFTESSAYVLNQISPEKRTEVLNAYFSKSGADYSLMRTHINSCDFSLKNYSYADVPGDTALKYFTVKEDLDDLVPLIKDARKISAEGFKLLASPWTAPPWMKDNNDWNGGSLKPEYYPVWAKFFVKYIEAYDSLGIDIWGVTVENEPLGNDENWESMIYTPEQMADFVKNHLGPTFQKEGIDANILIYDQNRDEVVEWAEKILGDPDAAKYVWGTAVHWYSSTISWYPEALNEVHKKFPDKHLMHTEGCIDSEVPVWKDDLWYWSKEATDWGYDWASPETKHLHPKYVPVFRYARDIIGGLNSWLTGWIDWNIVLDDKGGPNHAQNWCIAPVIVKPEEDEVYYTPLYYVMSHFSKYIRPGAHRIKLDINNSGIMATAAINEDKSIAVELFNPTEKEFTYSVEIAGKYINYNLPGNSLQTIIIK
ncbi:MAG: glycoside hydrolase family 30 protein [Melioribacter sp.]|uniref:glycoside hydrolase family 30 protein n=1 Tax=Melioribacter sp. TaxID=2052167 RepID=UPI003BCBC48C